MGRLRDELPHARTVVELDPLSARYNANLGYVYDLMALDDLAIAQHRRAIDLDPSIYMPHFFLGAAYGHMRRFEAAIAECEISCRLSNRNSRTLGGLAWLYGETGRVDEARSLMEELTTRSRSAYVPPFAMAAACRGTRDVEQQLTWLEKGVEDRDLQIVSILKVEPALAQYGHPRFRALLRKMNMEPECEPHSRCAIDIDSSQVNMSPMLHRIEG